MKFFLFNHQSEHKSDGNVFKVTRNSSSVRREIFLLVVKALHCSGCQACRGAHFPVVDRITGLVQHCTCSFQGVRVPVAQLQMDPPVCTPDSSNTPGLEVLACSFDNNLNYYNFIPAKSFFIANIIFLLVVFLCSQQSKNKQIKGSVTEPNRKIFHGLRPLATTRVHQAPSPTPSTPLTCFKGLRSLL